jgi:hypothetical protein
LQAGLAPNPSLIWSWRSTEMRSFPKDRLVARSGISKHLLAVPLRSWKKLWRKIKSVLGGRIFDCYSEKNIHVFNWGLEARKGFKMNIAGQMKCTIINRINLLPLHNSLDSTSSLIEEHRWFP